MMNRLLMGTGQLLGMLTVDANGKLTFVADENLNNENEDLSVDIIARVVDSDKDEDSSVISLELRDQDPIFIFLRLLAVRKKTAKH